MDEMEAVTEEDKAEEECETVGRVSPASLLWLPPCATEQEGGEEPECPTTRGMAVVGEEEEWDLEMATPIMTLPAAAAAVKASVTVPPLPSPRAIQGEEEEEEVIGSKAPSSVSAAEEPSSEGETGQRRARSSSFFQLKKLLSPSPSLASLLSLPGGREQPQEQEGPPALRVVEA